MKPRKWIENRSLDYYKLLRKEKNPSETLPSARHFFPIKVISGLRQQTQIAVSLQRQQTEIQKGTAMTTAAQSKQPWKRSKTHKF